MMATAPAQRVRDYLDIENPWDMRVYRHLRDEICTLANQEDEGGIEVPTVDWYSDWLECCEGGTLSNILRRLEGMKLIKVHRYQRTRQIKCLETGKWSAQPKNQTRHWREEAVTLGNLRRDDPDLAIDFQLRGEATGDLPGFMLSCLKAGYRVIQSQAEQR